MEVDLVEALTGDGFILDGLFSKPLDGHKASSSIDAFLLVHGTYGDFYTAGLIRLAKYLKESGFPVASFNTRAHDVISRCRKVDSSDIHGTAFENLSDCVQDLDATIAWLTAKGYNNIALLGVSMGAVKVIYYQSIIHNEHVKAVIAVSPVRLSRSFYMASEAASYYEIYHKQATLMTQIGKPESLINIAEEVVPGQGIFSAEAYLDKYGSEKYNIVNYAYKIKDPILLMSGTLETHPRLIACTKDTYDTFTKDNIGELMIVNGGDHSLQNIGDQLPNLILDWISRI